MFWGFKGQKYKNRKSITNKSGLFLSSPEFDGHKSDRNVNK